MHQALAYCPEHGVFPSGFGFGPSVDDSRLIGNRTQCPKCRRPCEVLDGTYSTNGEEMNVVLAETISPEARAAILAIIQKAQSGEYSHERAKEEVTRINPKVGRLFDVADWDGQAKATLYASIIAAIGITAAAAVSVAPSFIRREPYVIQTPVLPEKNLELPDSAPIPAPRPK